jgi:hypothetical protein
MHIIGCTIFVLVVTGIVLRVRLNIIIIIIVTREVYEVFILVPPNTKTSDPNIAKICIMDYVIEVTRSAEVHQD